MGLTDNKHKLHPWIKSAKESHMSSQLYRNSNRQFNAAGPVGAL